MGNGRRVPRQLAPERIRIAAIVLACASAVATAATRADDGAAPAPPPSSSTAAGGAAAQAPAPRAAERGRFIRRVEGDDGRVTLQVASRRYRDPAGGPTVTLVSAVHIGERGYYEAMQRLLDGHGAVLYESVTPRGAVTTRKAVADDPALATRESMLFLRRVMLAVRDARAPEAPAAPAASPPPDAAAPAASPPPVPALPSIDETIARSSSLDSRLEHWVRDASVDAWGGAIEIESADDGSFVLVSRGADKAPGGEGVDADIRLRTPKERRGSRPTLEDGIQGMLAKALGWEFQLDAVNYGGASWEVADMTEGELMEAFEARGVDGSPLLESLAGGGVSGSAARAMLMVLRVADGMTGGGAREMVRYFLVEALSMVDERMLAEGLSAELIQVILQDRNRVAIESLASRRCRGDDVGSIAIFYGAAHMPDLERRLLEQGMTCEEERWFDAMSADPDRAGVDEEMKARMRQLFSQFRRSPPAGEPAE